MPTYAADRAQPIEWTTAKDPADVVPYTFAWAAELETGETISTETTTVESGLTKDASAIDGTDVTVTVSGGTAGKRYSVGCEITTSTSRTLTVTGIVKCADR